MRLYNKGWDKIGNSGLAGLPTAGKLYAWQCDDAEADTDPADTVALLNRTAGAAVKNVTGLTFSSRILDLLAGVSLVWTEMVGGRAVVWSTKDPASDASAANELVAIQNVNAGAAWNYALNGPLSISGDTYKIAWPGET